MTNPTDNELDEAVAEVVGPNWYNMVSYQEGRNVAGTLHLDWNALMAAVAELEDAPNGDSFTEFSRIAATWSVQKNGHQFANVIFTPGILASEARALALCIHAVGNQ